MVARTLRRRLAVSAMASGEVVPAMQVPAQQRRKADKAHSERISLMRQRLPRVRASWYSHSHMPSLHAEDLQFARVCLIFNSEEPARQDRPIGHNRPRQKCAGLQTLWQTGQDIQASLNLTGPPGMSERRLRRREEAKPTVRKKTESGRRSSASRRYSARPLATTIQYARSGSAPSSAGSHASPTPIVHTTFKMHSIHSLQIVRLQGHHVALKYVVPLPCRRGPDAWLPLLRRLPIEAQVHEASVILPILASPIGLAELRAILK